MPRAVESYVCHPKLNYLLGYVSGIPKLVRKSQSPRAWIKSFGDPHCWFVTTVQWGLAIRGPSQGTILSGLSSCVIFVHRACLKKLIGAPFRNFGFGAGAPRVRTTKTDLQILASTASAWEHVIDLSHGSNRFSHIPFHTSRSASIVRNVSSSSSSASPSPWWSVIIKYRDHHHVSSSSASSSSIGCAGPMTHVRCRTKSVRHIFRRHASSVWCPLSSSFIMVIIMYHPHQHHHHFGCVLPITHVGCYTNFVWHPFRCYT